MIVATQNADPDVRRDMETFLSHVAVPEVDTLPFALTLDSECSHVAPLPADRQHH